MKGLEIAEETCITMNANGMMAIQHGYGWRAAMAVRNWIFIMCCWEDDEDEEEERRED
jgi:hypothetical protein